MNGKCILDSNIIIDIFRGNHNITDKITNFSEFFVPAIVIGELYFGAYKSQKSSAKIEQIDAFKKVVTVLNINDKTAKIYGEIKNNLKIKGKPIPENDIWIAAIAKENELSLFTRDKHFSEIKDLTILT